MIKKLRSILWRILGIDYNQILKKLDYTLLKNDKYVERGAFTYDNGAKVFRWTKTPLYIGNYCSIAHNVIFVMDEGYHTISEVTNYPFIHNNTHETELLEIRNKKEQKKGIEIGNDVWIGLNSVILPGVKIGNGVTIAAGSVVNLDIPDYAVVGGIPARIIRMKHANETINKLNQIAWWNWEESEIKKRKKDFYLSIEDFIKKYEN